MRDDPAPKPIAFHSGITRPTGLSDVSCEFVLKYVLKQPLATLFSITRVHHDATAIGSDRRVMCHVSGAAWNITRSRIAFISRPA